LILANLSMVISNQCSSITCSELMSERTA